jgi:tRNA U34 5-methylaminomethyl-2-thiouridine-forming methyltransferase MnmC
VAEKSPVIQAFDQDRWAETLDYHAERVELALAAVDVVRARTSALLRRLPEEKWASEGTHTDAGRYTAEDWLQTYAEHLEKHASQIERTLEAWRLEQTQPR